MTVCLWQQHLALFREWLGESQAAPCAVYTRSLELKVTHFAFSYQQPTLIALNSTDCRGTFCMGLHSSLLERMGCVWLGEAPLWLAWQQCPEVVWKCGSRHRSLCVPGQAFCVVCLCVGRETTGGSLGNEGFPSASMRPSSLPCFFSSRSCPVSLSRFQPLYLCSSSSRAGALSGHVVDFAVLSCGWWLLPVGWCEVVCLILCVSKNSPQGVLGEKEKR